ncbi:YihY/virulence factor BrkB family protein [Roseburia sp. NSJ-9]|uniref:YihY/virulence factor BrkB family protein n=1 Tax=Roseburia lenta TaxID=2763061 RepID=A0ABR7GIM0_9FIRM|nr:YihY/virulence factor BrkB family protein [Roseburia lenta]MBC5687106.1 YihY/virulence factor BrkB family protein [Roseburia lenta]
MIWMVIGYVKTYLDKCKRDNIGAFAAQAAFFIIMSAIPFLMVFTSLLQYTNISQEYVTDLLCKAMPKYIEPLLQPILNEVYSRPVGIISLTAIVALWAAGKALQYMTAGMNVLNGIDETRNWFVVRFWAIVYTIVFIFAIIIVLILMVFTEYIQSLLDQAFGVWGILVAIVSVRPLIRGLVVFAILTGLFVWLFTTLPNKKIKAYTQIPGALLCAAIWYVFSIFLSLYVNFYDRFSIYGSMSTIVLMMFWLYSCMYIMFMCAEANVFFAEVLGRFMRKQMGKIQDKWKAFRLRNKS